MEILSKECPVHSLFQMCPTMGISQTTHILYTVQNEKGSITYDHFYIAVKNSFLRFR